jgi:hypothetical protein
MIITNEQSRITDKSANDSKQILIRKLAQVLLMIMFLQT